MSKSCSIQALAAPPVTLSTVVHEAPSSFEIDTVSASFSTVKFANQRLYFTVAAETPERSKRGETSVVGPPSTSSPPTVVEPLPVAKQRTPAPGVASSSGLEGAPELFVPTGLP